MNLRMLPTTCCVAALLAFSGPARAQDAPAPAGALAAAQPDAPPPVETPPAAEPAKPATGNPSVDDASEIHANYDDTIGIYRGILERERTDTSALDRRIEANEQLIARYRPQLEQSSKALRQLQVRSYNEALALRRKLESGEISKAVYDKQIAQLEDELARERRVLEDDVRFYREELQAAQARLEELRLQREHVAAARRAAGVEESSTPKPGERLLGALRKTLDELGLFPTPPNTLAPPNRCRGCIAPLGTHTRP